MTICRWPPCCYIHCCSYSGKEAVTQYNDFLDPLNKVLNLLSYVINIWRMCFVYLTFDTAQNLVWLCNISWVAVLGVPKIFEHGWNLKNSLPEERCLHTECHAPRCLEQMLIEHRFPCMFSGQFFQADSFSISQTSPGMSGPWTCRTRILPLALCQKQVYKTQPVILVA